MGRHSSANQFYFYRSVVLYFLPWALVAAIAVTAVWAGVAALGQDELATRPPPVKNDQPSAKQKVAGGKNEKDKDREPTPTATPSTSPSPEPDPSETPEAAKIPLITADITVQVLNGTSASTADDEMADRLSGLGYDVVAVVPASTSYPRTTVFWSSSASKAAAEALAQRFGWAVERKPENLSPVVAIHVVVGADEV